MLKAKIKKLELFLKRHKKVKLTFLFGFMLFVSLPILSLLNLSLYFSVIFGFNNSLLIIYILLTVIGFSLYIVYTFKAASELIDKKLDNPFIHFSVIVCAIIIIFGVSVTSAIYRSPFPLLMSTNAISSENFTYNMDCRSFSNQCFDNMCEYPVIGRFLSCNLYVYNLSNVSNYEYFYYNNNYLSNAETTNKSSQGQLIKDGNNFKIEDFRVQVKNGFNEMYFIFTFNPQSGNEITLSTNSIRYTGITDDMYRRMINEKTSLFVTIVSFALISAFTVSKNLMDMWDRKKSKSKN